MIGVGVSAHDGYMYLRSGIEDREIRCTGADGQGLSAYGRLRYCYQRMARVRITATNIYQEMGRRERVSDASRLVGHRSDRQYGTNSVAMTDIAYLHRENGQILRDRIMVQFRSAELHSESAS